MHLVAFNGICKYLIAILLPPCGLRVSIINLLEALLWPTDGL